MGFKSMKELVEAAGGKYVPPEPAKHHDLSLFDRTDNEDTSTLTCKKCGSCFTWEGISDSLDVWLERHTAHSSAQPAGIAIGELALTDIKPATGKSMVALHALRKQKLIDDADAEDNELKNDERILKGE